MTLAQADKQNPLLQKKPSLSQRRKRNQVHCFRGIVWTHSFWTLDQNFHQHFTRYKTAIDVETFWSICQNFLECNYNVMGFK